MKFALECMAGELARALAVAQSVTDSGTKVPILKATRIEVGKKGAQFAATNSDQSIRVSVAAEGGGTIHCDTLALGQKAQALRPTQSVTMTGDEDGKFITMVQGKTRWRVPLLLGEGFPVEFTEPIKGKPRTIPREPFFTALGIANVNVIPSITSALGMGILIDQGDKRFRIVSAARHGLYVVELKAPLLAADIILPLDSARAMREIFKGSDELAIICEDAKGNLTAEAEGILYRTKLIEQAYGNWRDARDKQSAGLVASCVVARSEILDALRRTTAIAEDRDKSGAYIGIKTTIADGELTFSAKNRNGEEGTDTCAAEGDPGTFTTSAFILENALNSIIGDRVRLLYHPEETDKPAMMRPEPEGKQEDYRIIMPMRA